MPKERSTKKPVRKLGNGQEHDTTKLCIELLTIYRYRVKFLCNDVVTAESKSRCDIQVLVQEFYRTSDEQLSQPRNRPLYCEFLSVFTNQITKSDKCPTRTFQRIHSQEKLIVKRKRLGIDLKSFGSWSCCAIYGDWENKYWVDESQAEADEFGRSERTKEMNGDW